MLWHVEEVVADVVRAEFVNIAFLVAVYVYELINYEVFTPYLYKKS